MHFVTCKLMGGLGNNLFQISAAYSLSIRDNKKFICDKTDISLSHNPFNHYEKNIFKKIEFKSDLSNYEIFSENGFNHREIPKTNNNLKLIGYFQSEKYFKDNRKEILELFESSKETKEKLNKKYSDISFNNSCSIHVRRGDYLKLQDYHTVLDINYFKKAYESIGEEKEYLIFSDDLEWCKKNLSFIKNKKFIEGNTDYEDLYLMSICADNIISNSTFSWWGAWLNQNNNRVISPKKWFGPKNLHLDTNDLYCKEWIIL